MLEDFSNLSDAELKAKFTEVDTECKHLSFKLFTLYNIRDTEILKLLDEKFKFIALTNQMAHENTVPFSAIMGTVKYVETGITNHAHNVLKRIAHDKVIIQNEKVEGAIVLTPWIGLHQFLGSVDLKSLYPNVIRSLNISPEKIIGQFANAEDEMDWLAIYQGHADVNCVLMLESGEQISKSAIEWRDYLKENKWAVSAYGTVFDQGNGRGVIPDILGFWYNERKRLQGEKKKWGKKVESLKKQGLIDTPEYNEAVKLESDFDLLQLTKKIAMNSLYGALLNAAFRYGDVRMGASTTASGRRITKHMMESIHFILTGKREEMRKSRVWEKDELKIMYDFPTTPERVIIYGDTDSLFSQSEILSNYGLLTIEQLFNANPIKREINNGKQFAEGLTNLKVSSFKDGNSMLLPVKSIYRHKVKKARWKITLEDGKTVEITNDHSIMVERDDKLIEVKPADIKDTDIFLSID